MRSIGTCMSPLFNFYHETDIVNRYCDYVKACLTHSRVPDKLREKPHLIDHRYFFQREDKTGGYTCGIVRDAIAEELFQNEQRFPGVDFWKSIKKPWMT